MSSDTPRTDAVKTDMWEWSFVDLDFARQLERELNAAREELEAFKNNNRYHRGHSAGYAEAKDDCESELLRMANRATKAEAELASAREELQKERARLEQLAKLMPVPGRQGVIFPANAWLSYDRLTGYEGEDGPNRDAFYSSHTIARAIMQWANNVRAILAAMKEDAK